MHLTLQALVKLAPEIKKTLVKIVLLSLQIQRILFSLLSQKIWIIVLRSVTLPLLKITIYFDKHLMEKNKDTYSKRTLWRWYALYGQSNS